MFFYGSSFINYLSSLKNWICDVALSMAVVASYSACKVATNVVDPEDETAEQQASSRVAFSIAEGMYVDTDYSSRITGPLESTEYAV